MKNFFTVKIIDWHLRYNKRIMPWKEEKDPYKIWLSEIILQQTRVQQGISYYNKFVQTYPSVTALAAADDEAVFKLWEGLGYYTRCKNLLATARTIANEFGGNFPDTYENILQLKGVGPYTASAIASFAYGLPNAVVDGNVLRVLSRYFGVSTAIDTAEGINFFKKLAAQLLYKKDPATYNQAIMDFGATVCTPQIPKCETCVLRDKCKALANQMTNVLPVKQKKLIIKKRWFYYFVFQCNEQVLVSQRQARDIWQNLHEFVLMEADKPVRWNEESVTTWAAKTHLVSKLDVVNISPMQKQQLTHQQINGQFIFINIPLIPTSLNKLKRINVLHLRSLAFPRFITKYLEDTDLFLKAWA